MKKSTEDNTKHYWLHTLYRFAIYWSQPDFVLSVFHWVRVFIQNISKKKYFEWKPKPSERLQDKVWLAPLPPPPQPFKALFSGPLGWAGARRELLDFMVQGKIKGTLRRRLSHMFFVLV